MYRPVLHNPQDAHSLSGWVPASVSAALTPTASDRSTQLRFQASVSFHRTPAPVFQHHRPNPRLLSRSCSRKPERRSVRPRTRLPLGWTRPKTRAPRLPTRRKRRDQKPSTRLRQKSTRLKTRCAEYKHRRLMFAPPVSPSSCPWPITITLLLCPIDSQ